MFHLMGGSTYTLLIHGIGISDIRPIDIPSGSISVNLTYAVSPLPPATCDTATPLPFTQSAAVPTPPFLFINQRTGVTINGTIRFASDISGPATNIENATITDINYYRVTIPLDYTGRSPVTSVVVSALFTSCGPPPTSPSIPLTYVRERD